MVAANAKSRTMTLKKLNHHRSMKIKKLRHYAFNTRSITAFFTCCYITGSESELNKRLSARENDVSADILDDILDDLFSNTPILPQHRMQDEPRPPRTPTPPPMQDDYVLTPLIPNIISGKELKYLQTQEFEKHGIILSIDAIKRALGLGLAPEVAPEVVPKVAPEVAPEVASTVEAKPVIARGCAGGSGTGAKIFSLSEDESDSD